MRTLAMKTTRLAYRQPSMTLFLRIVIAQHLYYKLKNPLWQEVFYLFLIIFLIFLRRLFFAVFLCFYLVFKLLYTFYYKQYCNNYNSCHYKCGEYCRHNYCKTFEKFSHSRKTQLKSFSRSLAQTFFYAFDIPCVGVVNGSVFEKELFTTLSGALIFEKSRRNMSLTSAGISSLCSLSEMPLI